MTHPTIWSVSRSRINVFLWFGSSSKRSLYIVDKNNVSVFRFILCLVLLMAIISLICLNFSLRSWNNISASFHRGVCLGFDSKTCLHNALWDPFFLRWCCIDDHLRVFVICFSFPLHNKVHSCMEFCRPHVTFPSLGLCLWLWWKWIYVNYCHRFQRFSFPCPWIWELFVQTDLSHMESQWTFSFLVLFL